MRKTLTEFGQYVGEMLPKYVQKVEVTNCEELDIMIHPEGVIPTLQFLKDHHNAQFLNIIDIAGMDVPAREYRFEVTKIFSSSCFSSPIFFSGAGCSKLTMSLVNVSLKFQM